MTSRYCSATSSDSPGTAIAIRRKQVVSELRTLVDAFEDIVDACAMEKIKTIGDAFLATAGLLHPMENGVLAAVRVRGR